MHKANKLLIGKLILATALAPCGAAAEEAVVREGDTLSKILQEKRKVPLYGISGSVRLAVELNPHLAATQGNRLTVGSRIRLPGNELVEAAAPVPTRAPASAPALAPVPAEAPAAAPTEAGELRNQSRLAAEVGFEYFKNEATDKRTGGKSTVLSNLSPAARLTWDLDWNAAWSTRMRFKVQKDKLLDESAGRRAIQNASASRKSVEAGVVRKWSPTSRSSATVGFEERAVQYAPTTGAVTMDHVGSGVVKVGHEFEFARANAAVAGAGAEAKAILSASAQGHETNLGFGGEAFVFLRHERETVSLQGTLSYGLAKESSNLIKQTESRLGATLGISWKFD